MRKRKPDCNSVLPRRFDACQCALNAMVTQSLVKPYRQNGTCLQHISASLLCNAQKCQRTGDNRAYLAGSSVTSRPVRVVWIRVGTNCTPA